MTQPKIFLSLCLLLLTHAPAQISFDANFESGNLKTVTTTDSINYTITTNTDIGGRWFYFRIKNVKNKYLSVNVSSSDVKRAVYSYNDKDWERFSSSESPSTNVFQKTYAHDTVYVAYYIPYNYSFLQERITTWLQNSFVKLDTLGFTLRNFPIQELTITDPSIPNLEKIDVWIHARTHPGETPSSWHFDGFIDELIKNNPVVKHYLKKFVFHCIPFTNPDGVYYGRSRTNYDGIDVEANWNQPDSLTCKEVLILKSRMNQINNIKPLRVFQNLHSQASPYCTFWIHTASSTSPLFYKRETEFANLNTSENSFFEKSDYRFSNLLSKFPEGWLWANWGDTVMALTYETPYDFYSSSILVTNENLAFLGEHMLYAIAEFLQISHEERIILDNKNVVSFWNSSQTGINFFGENYLYKTSSSPSGTVEFASPTLKRGNYDVFAWWQDSSINATNAKFTIQSPNNSTTIFRNQKNNGGEWNFLANIGFSDSGKINIVVSDSADGRIIADALRIIYRGEQSNLNDISSVNNFELFQNYPNPFNSSTTIQFILNQSEKIKLQILNSLGELILTLADEQLSAGMHKYQIDAQLLPNLASGIYYYRLQTSVSAKSKGMIYLK